MSSRTAFEPITGPSTPRLVGALVTSGALHGLLLLLVFFEVIGPGGGFGIGIGPGFGIGAGGGVGLGEKRREIFSLKDLPEPVRPSFNWTGWPPPCGRHGVAEPCIAGNPTPKPPESCCGWVNWTFTRPRTGPSSPR